MGLTKKDYQDALNSQSACNLSGIVHTFSKVVSKIWEHAHSDGRGTEWVNKHPICRLYAEQIAHLSGAGMGDSDSYHKAYTACMDRVEEVHNE